MEMLEHFESFKKNKILVIQSKIYLKNRYKSFSCVIKSIKDKFAKNLSYLIDSLD